MVRDAETRPDMCVCVCVCVLCCARMSSWCSSMVGLIPGLPTPLPVAHARPCRSTTHSPAPNTYTHTCTVPARHCATLSLLCPVRHPWPLAALIEAPLWAEGAFELFRNVDVSDGAARSQAQTAPKGGLWCARKLCAAVCVVTSL